MGRRDQSLLSQIENDAPNSSTALADALRKCVALAGRAGSRELHQWALRELRGYGPGDKLPEYRIVPAPIHLDGALPNALIRRQRISPSQLPSVVHGEIDENVKVRHSVGQLEALIGRGHPAKFSLPLGADVVRLMNHDLQGTFQAVHDVYWTVDVSSLVSVVDSVRTALVELVAELRVGIAGDAHEVPSPEAADQAVNVAIHGDRSHVVVTTGRVHSNIGFPPGAGTRGRRWARAGAGAVGIATIVAAIIGLLQWMSG